MSTLEDLLHSLGLARVSAEISSVALPSIRLKAQAVDETRLAPGATKFGGTPDLPQGDGWPECNGSPLPFVAQLDLTDMAHYDIKHTLPGAGRLYFFFDVDAFFVTRPRDHATWKVWYDTSPLSALQRVSTPMAISKRRRYHPCVITCSPELTLPDYSRYDSTSLRRLGLSQPLTDEEEQAYYEVQAQLAGMVRTGYHIPIHRVLGHPDDVQWDMHDELPGAPGDWRFLFQVDSDGAPGTDWGDTGRIYYWIRAHDLARGDFSQVHVMLQST